ncbi:MAG: hypothetical protein ACRD2B_14015, partial [Terriglobia bacterium]
TEIVRFANGACEHVAIFRNPQFDDGGWGNFPTSSAPGWAGRIDNSLFEMQANVTIDWGHTAQTYDVRGRKDLGSTPKTQIVLEPWTPLVFTRAANPLPPLQVELPAEIRAGAPLRIRVKNAAFLPDGTFRVVRLEFATPQGEPYPLYARNLLLKSTPQTELVPLARNDPAGRWKLIVREVMTGSTLEKPFTVQG